MKALTICQPYAHLIVTPEGELPSAVTRKRVENRRWAVEFRGLLAIHAGKGLTWLDPGDRRRFPTMAFGAVVGVADLVGCVRIRSDGSITAADRQRFPWLENHPHAEGPVGWVLDRVRRFREPIPASGAQGLWDWTPPADWEDRLEPAEAVANA